MKQETKGASIQTMLLGWHGFWIDSMPL